MIKVPLQVLRVPQLACRAVRERDRIVTLWHALTILVDGSLSAGAPVAVVVTLFVVVHVDVVIEEDWKKIRRSSDNHSWLRLSETDSVPERLPVRIGL